jgi:SEC-C motif domain protein
MSMAKSQPQAKPCPCGGGSYDACCGRYIGGAEVAPSAEALMRSRYSAYTLGDEAYLRATWHSSSRPQEPIIDAEQGLTWLGLEVKSALRLRKRKAKDHDQADALPATGSDVPAGDEATVEFVARYKIGGRAHRLHEISRFVREQGRWFYVDGSFPE